MMPTEDQKAYYHSIADLLLEGVELVTEIPPDNDPLNILRQLQITAPLMEACMTEPLFFATIFMIAAKLLRELATSSSTPPAQIILRFREHLDLVTLDFPTPAVDDESESDPS